MPTPQEPTTDERIIDAISAHLALVFLNLGTDRPLIQVNITELPESNAEEPGPYIDIQCTARLTVAEMAMSNPSFGREGLPLPPAVELDPIAAPPIATAGRIDSDAERKKRTRFYGDN